MDHLEIEKLQCEIKDLKIRLLEKEKRLKKLLKNEPSECPYSDHLSTEEISRYSRQMLVPQMGLHSQKCLKNSNIVIVGVGGLGCPAALYLAAAGVGTITLLDYDEVEISNLHRQILHSEQTVGSSKVDSAYSILHGINSEITIIPLKMSANKDILNDLFTTNKYDLVIDGSDNVATRYLLNDICVLNNIPLISGSALQLEGQLTVYNYENGPCYRCLFPKPPPADTVTNCGDGGVLGPVPGVIGVLQALEAIKILTKMPDVLSGRLLIFDAANTSFMNVKLRNKQENCAVCGTHPTIRKLIDYEIFCNSKANDKVVNIDILPEENNISVLEMSNIMKNSIFIDVRPKIEYEICKLSNSINVPYSYISNNSNLDEVKTILEKYKSETSTVYFLCRRGNDSQRVVSYLSVVLRDDGLKFVNIRGGLHAYARFVDPSFPVY